MKLYKVVASSTRDDQPTVVKTWVGTQSDAAAARKARLAEGFKRAELDTEEVDVPTNKQDLLVWLNENCA